MRSNGLTALVYLALSFGMVASTACASASLPPPVSSPVSVPVSTAPVATPPKAPTAPAQAPNKPPPTTPPVANSNTVSTQPTFEPIAFAALNFADNPGGNDPNAIALTFDDGPTGNLSGTDNTAYILDQLKALNLHATFFLCGDVWTDVLTDPSAQADIKRIVAEGHDIANHTFDHPTLDTVSQAQVSIELAKQLTVLQDTNVLGAKTSVSMYRLPFGIPYQADNANVTWMAPLTAKYGVHVGWGIDSDDWKCAQGGQDANCIVNNVVYQLNQGHSGVILMHAVYKLTGDALPAVVQAIYARGYHIVAVQDMIRAKYGATSQEILQGNAQATFTSAQISSAAVNACGQNDFAIDPPY